MQLGRLKRREFIALLGGAAVAWPSVTRAQQTPQVPRVGLVYPGSKTALPSRIEAILSGLRVSGFAAPAQIELVVRTAEGDPAQIAPLVAEVIAATVNVFIANGPAVLHAARTATRTIPIVAIDLETDPVASGAAATLARPGGNITGVFLDFPDFTAKWVEMLVESSSKLSRIAVLWDPTTGPVQMESIKKAGEALKLELDIIEVKRPSDFEGAFSTVSQRRAGALVILSSQKYCIAFCCSDPRPSPSQGRHGCGTFRCPWRGAEPRGMAA